ncbi:MAG: cytochrome o ubiquinol oxidase subunit IV [Nevskia sp.]|uniref:cytochrome o ubiquinol oxidase subunit IV n=1 Tax=Nevskia sp. TaxID=1929292 RepID=UPI0040366B97
MSAADLHKASANAEFVHGHDEAHDDHHDDGIPHAAFKDYLIGFLLSVLLTAVPFWLVMADVLPSKLAATAIIVVFAIAQMLVHIVYFLHLDSRSQGGWNMLAAIFTVVLVVITIAGSLWVMFHMNDNMMPAMVHEMGTSP